MRSTSELRGAIPQASGKPHASAVLRPIRAAYKLAAECVRGLAVALLVLSLCFAIGETALRLIGYGDPYLERVYPQGYFRRGPGDLPRAKPGHWNVLSRNKESGEAVYDVHYTIDEFGKRVTPVDTTRERRAFALFFGCSFTFGEGVEDRETLPYHFAARATEYMPYNFGFHGGGPFDVLAKVQTLKFDLQVAEHRGLGLYVFIDDHIARVTGSSGVASWNGVSLFYERMPDGQFVRNGTFETARPEQTSIYRALGKSRMLTALGLNFPPWIGRSALDRTAEVLAAVHHNFRRRLPQSPFYVVFYPGTQHASEIAKRLAKVGVPYLDYSSLWDAEDLSYQLDAFDAHPSPKAHATLAAALARDLPGVVEAAGGPTRDAEPSRR